MRRRFWKVPYVLMALFLLINLLVPSGLVRAETDTTGSTTEAVSTSDADAPASGEGAVTPGDQGTDMPAGDAPATPGEETPAVPAEPDPSTGAPAASDLAAAEGDVQADADPAAQGEVITENIITDVQMKDDKGNKLQDIRIDMGATVQVDVYWTLPADHGFHEGATFTFDLPDKFKPDRALDGILTGDVGTYHITSEGKVTFTFSKEIEDNNEWSGDFYVWRNFDGSKFSGGTKQDIVFDYPDDPIIIPIHFNNPTDSEIDKSGTPNKAMNPSEITWTVDFNKGERMLTDAQFKDALPAGLELIPASIEVHKLEVQLNGSVKEDPELFIGYDTTPAADGFELKFNGSSDSAYRVHYKTKITQTTDTTYTNNVEVDGGGPPLTKSAKVDTKYSKPLGKKSTGYDANSQTISWAIEYNYNEQSLPQAKAWINDKFDTSTQELVDDSFKVYEMTIADNGTASQKTETLPLLKDTDYTVTKTAEGFKLQFSRDVNAAYEIQYKTKASGRVYEDGNVQNTVSMPDVPDVTVGKDIKQVIFWKTYTGTNYADKTIDWKLSLNDDNKNMTDVVITDNFADQHMELISDSVKIEGLTEGTDYKLEPDPRYDTGFKITFTNPINANYLITYKTKFDPTAGKMNEYTNTAKVDWKESDGQKSINKTASAPADNFTKNNGSKTGSYDAKTKEITWNLNVNYNLYQVSQPVVRDFYTGEQTFLPESLVVQPLELTGGANGVNPNGAPLVLNDDYTLKTLTENGTDGFELVFNKPIDGAYRITYKTSLKDHPVAASYSNAAEMFDRAQPDSKLFAQSTNVNPQFGGEYINKTGVQGAGADQDFAYWTLNVNRSQSIVDNAVLTDTLSENQILIPSSFELYSTAVDKNGNLTQKALVSPAAYMLDVKDNAFTLTFKDTIQEAYILKYKSFINADNGDTISNNAKFAGQSSGSVSKDENKSVNVSFSGAGGGAQTGKGDLTITKVDAADNAPLEGARFGLYDKTGSTLIRELVTDKEGKAVFSSTRYNDYVLKELAAPAGYLIDDEYRNGKKMTFKADAAEITVTNTKGIWDFELTKVDKDDSAKVLEGAVFKLQKDVNGAFEDVTGKTELNTGEDGKILLAHLEAGDYQLIEVQAPKGYRLDATPIPFTIEVNQSITKQKTVANEIYVGSVQLTKTDAYDGSPLEGAVFNLLDEQGHEVVTGLTTDADGKVPVPNLKAGSYMFVEVTPPVGYQSVLEPLKFEIVDDQPLLLNFTNDKITGSLKITKIQTGRLDIPLKGAEFRILDENKQPVLNAKGEELAGLVTDEHGELGVDDLRPGKYYAEETAAPSGYYIWKAQTEFEIVSGQETAITVENGRSTGGGGGGSTDGGGDPGGGGNQPNPPVTPTPDPDEPQLPGDSGTPEGPQIPNIPGGVIIGPAPSDPGQPNQPEQPAKPGQPNGGGTAGTGGAGTQPSPGHETDPGENSSAGSHTGSSQKPGGSSTEGAATLPKTGEASHLPMQLAGVGLIALGAALFGLKKRQAAQKQL
ncbi:collagen binding domain-containing protein [Paenibacillus sp. XY044]|uniref:collagen binding domain-containing protein n=1 Tax=Paenibacillus sp. XY044 TaxID=2026089 RepID=UPI000B98B359|nr:collagen binding domain-containing protein [Paenibacillus sp. XY044]OZB90855.1 hypothetical protein CJP46_31055 [Paenibacillus sp. XY044]